MDMNLSKLPEMVKDREAWHSAVHGVTENWTCLSYRTRTIYVPIFLSVSHGFYYHNFAVNFEMKCEVSNFVLLFFLR